MKKCLKNRGPDADGIYEDENYGLINSRLKILDLSDEANQPMFFKDQENDLVIVYNGEVYNFWEIRKELETLGHSFKTTSDTEVLLHAFAQWGINFLQKLNGMFAFALLDRKNNELYLVRDRLGIKPLFYSLVNNEKENQKILVFGSNIPAILSSGLVSSQHDIEGVSSYLSFRYALGEKTLFKNIKKLLPGHYIHVKEGNLNIVEWWDLDLSSFGKRKIPFSQTKNEVLNRFSQSTKYRMISDVPVGAYLSGGVDSSAVVAFMSRHTDHPVKTYTVGFEEDNEFEYAKIIAEKFNTDHKEIIVSPEKYFETMIELIHEKGEPLGVPNEIPLYLMSKELRKDIVVVLSGEGADELFYGYGRIFQLWYDFERLKKAEKSLLHRFLYSGLVEKYKGWDTRDYATFFVQRYSYVPFELKERLFKENLWAETLKKDQHIYEFFQKVFKKPFSESLNNQDATGYVFLKVHLPNLLGRVDNSTMATSVEARVPFLDHNLVEFVTTLNREIKVKWKSLFSKIKAIRKSSDEISENHDIPKYVLKKSLEGILPDEILYRRKKGFPVPLQKWFSSEAVKIVKRLILEEGSFTKQLFKKEELENLILNYDGSYQKAYLIWFVLNLEVWYMLFIERKTPEEIISKLKIN